MPSIVTVPASGSSSPAIRLSSVDLPMPDSPMIATNSPCSNVERDVTKNAPRARPEKVFERSETEITAHEITTRVREHHAKHQAATARLRRMRLRPRARRS